MKIIPDANSNDQRQITSRNSCGDYMGQYIDIKHKFRKSELLGRRISSGGMPLYITSIWRPHGVSYK